MALSEFAEKKYKNARESLEKIEAESRQISDEESQLRDEQKKLATNQEDQEQSKTRIAEIEARLAVLGIMQDDWAAEYDEYEHALLEAAATKIRADFIVENGDIHDALSLALNELETLYSGQSGAIAQLKEQVADAKSKLTEAKNAGDAGAIKTAQSDLAKFEKSLQVGQANLSGGYYGCWLGTIIAYVKSGKVKHSCEKEFDGGAQAPARIQVRRRGLNGAREIILAGNIDCEGVREIVESAIPRVELIDPVDKVSDAVTRSDIDQPEFAFMRGVFYYAGLKRETWDSIFVQDDVSVRQLDAASDRLNETLRMSWSQGRNLSFFLKHNSGTNQIDLYINDPVITKKYVRVSRRSTGFTHFFTLKTVLYSRQAEARARSYLWLFDEPGLYLHPVGQQDLLQVLETLAASNQIAYSTHSLFMINKNYPSRHRLVTKAKAGTKVDGKPHQGQWKAALEALGLSLPGTILFANKILLVEGDSDPTFLNSILQKLIELGKIEVDVNPLAIVSTGDSKNADALIRIFSEAVNKPKVAALFDGDDGGKRRAKSLSDLLRKQKIDYKLLDDDTTIEDHLIGVRSVFVSALAQYLAKVGGSSLDSMRAKLAAQFSERHGAEESATTKGIASWARAAGRELAKLDDDPSSLGVAREYALLLADVEKGNISDGECERAVKIAEWVAKSLELGPQILSENQIIEGA